MRAVKNNLPAPSGEVGESEGSRLGKWHVSMCQWVGGWNVARSWDHPTHPLKVTARCGLAWDKARLGAPGLGG